MNFFYGKKIKIENHKQVNKEVGKEWPRPSNLFALSENLAVYIRGIVF